MTDLYAALDIGRDASRDEIRKAYRKAAKRAHPDTATGSKEKFAKVTTALAVLSDDERRRYYDQTGKIDNPPADDRQAKAMNLAVAEIGKVANQIEMRRGRIEEFDILGDAKRGLEEQLAQAQEAVRKSEKSAESAKKLAERFGSKKGKSNRLGPLISNWGAEHTRNAAKNKDVVETIELAIAILNEHTFKTEPRSW